MRCKKAIKILSSYDFYSDDKSIDAFPWFFLLWLTFVIEKTARPGVRIQKLQSSTSEQVGLSPAVERCELAPLANRSGFCRLSLFGCAKVHGSGVRGRTCDRG